MAASLLHYVAQLRQRVLLSVVGVMLAAFALAAGLFFGVAADLDARAARQSERAVQAALKQRGEALARTLFDYASWGEAYANLHARVSPAWAFDQQNLGPTLFSSFGIDDVFVVGPDGRETYAVVQGRLSDVSLRDRLGPGVADLVAAARRTAPDTSTVAAGSLMVDGAPVLAAAAALSTGFDASIAATAGPPSVLVFGDRLTTAELDAIAAAAFVSGLHVADHVRDATGLPHLVLDAGPHGVATLAWTPDRPGHEMIVAVLPWFLVAAGALAAFLILVVHHGMRAAEELRKTATELADAHRRAEHQSRHDALTGLPNRTVLSAFLKAALHDRPRGLVVLYLDLDRFKPVNDAFGHEAGDQVLGEVARRLKHAMREADLVARVGGDEFVIVAFNPSGGTIDGICRRLLEAVSAPIAYRGAPLSVDASIGVAVAPADGETADALIRNADVALFRAKGGGRNGYRCFSASTEACAAVPSPAGAADSDQGDASSAPPRRSRPKLVASHGHA